VAGTYGLVWFLTDKTPHTFAVKTVNPEKKPKSGEDIVENLRREFRIWLDLPSTYNVLSAIGFDIGPFWDSDKEETIELPVMRMPTAEGSLRAWVERPADYPEADRLLALAQALNGLQYLYDHDVEGHGDLKPENLLYDDLRDKVHLGDQPTWPSSLPRWRIQVADLGWADAWVDLGFSTKALREYLAPERLDGVVVPIKSDMFSMGVIASELLQGLHPAANLKKVLGSEGKWRRWVEGGERELKNIRSPRLREVIERCLNPSPDKRPDALEFLNEILVESKSTYGLDVAGTLELWRRPAFGDNGSVALNEHAAWAAAEAQSLGAKQAQASLDKIRVGLTRLRVVDFESLEAWVPIAETLVQSAAGNSDEQNRIRNLASEHLIAILAPIDMPALKEIPPRDDWAGIREFERFSTLIGRLAKIAGITAPPEPGFFEQLGPYARSALYFDWAGTLHFPRGDLRAAMEMLTSAIAEAPDESTNYYFRANWKFESLIIGRVKCMPAPYTVEEIVTDLDTAIKLAPDWEEPKKQLQNIHRCKSQDLI
jgi:Protein kinase domain